MQTIAKGEILQHNGQIQHKDGSITGNTGCNNYAIYHPDGTPKVTGEKPSPTMNGWIESTSIMAPTNQSYSAILDTNVVPPTPKNFEGQMLFFFPGLEDINKSESILQPVLIYNVSGWSVANYNCCLSGIVTMSTPFPTAPGDEIDSSITQNCKPGTLTCATWNIYSYDTKTRKSTALLNTPSQGQEFNWAFGAVLEPYGVNYCDDYPSKQETYTMLVLDEQFRPVTPKWVPAVNTTATPQCGYGVTTQPFQNTLEYNSTIDTPTFSLSVSPTSGTLAAGSAPAPMNITVSNLSSSGTVVVTVGSIPNGSYENQTLPAGATQNGNVITFTQNGVVVGNIYDYNFPGTPVTYDIPITATMTGAATVTDTYALTVGPATAATTVVVSPLSQTVDPATSGTPISITVSNMPPGDFALLSWGTFRPVLPQDFSPFPQVPRRWPTTASSSTQTARRRSILQCPMHNQRL